MTTMMMMMMTMIRERGGVGGRLTGGFIYR
jgi:hypothetical protein